MLKSILFLTSLFFIFTAHAFEYEFMLENRADLVHSDKKTTSSAGVTTTEKFNNFSNGLVRLSMFGAINESLSYRLRYRFLASPASPTNAREFTNTNNGFDHMFIDHIVGSYRTRMGKQNWLEAFGRESFLSGTDIFLSTLASVNYKAGFGSDYRYGVSFIKKFHDQHQVTFALSNPNNSFTDTSGSETNNTSLAYALFYNGTMLNALFQPVFAYSVAPQDGDTDRSTSKTKKGNHSLMALGFKSEIQKFTVIETDYKVFEKENRNGEGNTSLPKEVTKSIYLNAYHTLQGPNESLTLLGIYIIDQFDSEASANDKKMNSYALGLMWKPYNKINFRYHLVYTSATTKPDGSTSTVSEIEDKKILLGIRAEI